MMMLIFTTATTTIIQLDSAISMNKPLKYLGFTVIIIITLLFIIPLLIPLENYKDRIASEVKKATGRDLVIDGKIGLTLIPTISVKLHNVKLSSLPGSQTPSLLAVKTIKVALAPLKLITGRIAVSFIELDQPEINLERLANQTNNWQLSKPTSNVSDQLAQGAASKPFLPPFAIEQIIINSGKVQYIEGNTTTIITNIDIDSRIGSLKGPIVFKLNFNFLNQDFDLAGEIEQIGQTMPISVTVKLLGDNLNIKGAINLQTLSFSGGAKLQGNLNKFKQFIADIKIPAGLQHDYKCTANIVADQEKVTIDHINLALGELQANGSGNYFVKKGNGLVRLNLNPGNINLTLTPHKSDQGELKGSLYIEAQAIKPLMETIKIDTSFLPTLFNKNFSFSTDGSYQNHNLLLKNINFISGNAVTLQGVVEVKNLSQAAKIVTYDLTTNNGSSLLSLSGVKLPFTIANLSVKGETVKNNDNLATNTFINTAKVDTHVQGNIALAKVIMPSIRLNSAGNNLSQTLQSLFRTSLNPSLGAFSLSANIEGDLSKTIKLILDKARFIIGNNTTIIDAKAILALNEIRPKLTINLEASSVNLDDLVGKGTSAVAIGSQKSLDKDRQGTQDEGRWSGSKIDLSALRFFDGDVNLSLHKLMKGSLVFDNIKAKMLLKNRRLDLSSLTAHLYGGCLEASGHLSAQGQQALSLNADLRGAQLKNIMPERKAIKITQGNFNLKANIKSAGGSQYQYVNNLSGKVNFDAANGRLSGINLQKTIDALTHINNKENVLGLLDNSFSGGETAFKTIVGSLAIEQGLANLHQFKLDAGKLTASARGNINIPKYWLDIVSTLSVDVNNLPPFSVHLYGMLDDPQHKLDTKALAKHIVQNVLTNIIDKAKNGKGKPDDIIKGIIGFGNKKQTNSPDDQQRGQEGTDSKNEDFNPANILIKKGLKKLFK